MEHLTEDEFQDIYHKHITKALSDVGSAKQRTDSLHIYKAKTRDFQ